MSETLCGTETNIFFLNVKLVTLILNLIVLPSSAICPLLHEIQLHLQFYLADLFNS